jgi:ribose 5-phosphate isomerase B
MNIVMPERLIAIAGDHAGVALKETLKQELQGMGWRVEDLGTQGTQSVDYPDYANKLAQWMKQNPGAKGVLICGSGVGISIAANRHNHIRAVLAYNEHVAQMSRKHNDANVICFGERMMDAETAKSALKEFLNTEFEGGRHTGRVEKLTKGE